MNWLQIFNPGRDRIYLQVAAKKFSVSNWKLLDINIYIYSELALDFIELSAEAAFC